jgi:hypothetical protein
VALRAEGLADLPADLLIDGGRLRQVLLNLIGNAVKFTEAGSITVTAAYDATHERLSVSVLDTGPGIASEDVDLLFRRFSQVDAGLTRKHGGTGLGLAICKGLVEAMGGQIGVISIPGRGACFSFDVVAPSTAHAEDSAPREIRRLVAAARLPRADRRRQSGQPRAGQRHPDRHGGRGRRGRGRRGRRGGGRRRSL